MHRNQQETLYSSILDPLLRYLREKDTDFGLMVTAPWGTGKTYFVQNVFRPSITEAGYDASDWMYVSLNGLSEASAIARAVLVRSLLNENQRDRIGSIIDTFLDTATAWEKPRGIVTAATSLFTVKKRGIQRKLRPRRLDLSRIVLVLDDLERISPSLPIEEVLGSLYDAFISKGVKTIVICAANEITDQRTKNALNRSTEKVFRWTIGFSPDENLLAQCVIDERYEDRHGYDQLAANLPRVLKALQVLGMRVNLRTIVFLSDLFLDIYPIVMPITDGDDDAVRAIFDTTAVMAYEFKLGHIQPDTNLQDTTYLFHYLKNANSQEQEESLTDRIRNLYIGRGGLTFRPLATLQNLITSGRLHQDELEREVRKEFTDDRPAYAVVRDRLFHFRELDEDQYWTTLTDVAEHLAAGDYPLTDIFHIYRALVFLFENGYPTRFTDIQEIQELAWDAIRTSNENPDNVPDEAQLDSFNQSFPDQFLIRNPFLRELRDEVAARADDKESRRLEGLVDRLFDTVDQNDSDFGSVVGEIDNRRLFHTIVRTGRQQRFRTLKPAGIRRFESFMQSNILAESALAPQYLSHELEPVRTVIAELAVHIETLSPQSFLRRRFQDLLDILNEAEHKLSESVG